ncbi:acyl-CoA dehydrogenase family protein [Sphingomonas sp. SRS2]|uniref:acyl-CoA dehydrogenase family protein n=1 Tax=Sphingomonas sp. SRS2 TaxID=133190 RepID=UPI0006184C14|nr:acyl-CoA dehydrogenase family protein [Sphingomonas sp. SRS2]KKC25207.1 hypothetical protein WP12_15115 [Sphingomonas sp. SRS2]
MEFAWPPEALRFASEVSDFLDQELPDWWSITSNTLTAGQRHFEFCRGFAEKLANRGYLMPNWPREYGGREVSSWELYKLSEVFHTRGEPRGQHYMSANWVGPAIMRYGTAEQKSFFLPQMASGLIQFCQGFSEPGAGSDLAAIRTRATRDGDQYAINGQKIWTSYAATADYCVLLARTDPASQRRDGISMLLVPTNLPGITIRPIPNLLGIEGGEHGFCEIFFDDVRIDISARLGAENGGWAAAMDALAFERVGQPRFARALRLLDLTAEQCAQRGELEDPIVAEKLGLAIAACQAARVLNYRVVDSRARAEPPGPEGNVARMASVQADQLAADMVFALSPDALDDDSMADEAMRSAMPAGHAAGSIEVNLNIIAERLLGLPRAS